MTESVDELTSLLQGGLTLEAFSPKFARIVKVIINFYSKYNKVPTMDIVLKHLPDLDTNTPRENPAMYYWDTLTRVRKLDMIKTTLSKLTNTTREVAETELGLVDTVVDKALTDFIGVKNAYNSSEDRLFKVSELTNESITTYQRKEEGSYTGLPIPFELLNDAIMFWEAGKLQTVLSRSGVGKTWYVLINALAAIKEGYKVLIASLEMTKEEVVRRMIALGAGLNYTNYRKGTLTAEEKVRLMKFVDELNDPDKLGNNLIIAGTGQSVSKPDILMPIIKSMNPALVIVDAFYLQNEVPGDERWKKVSYLTSEYKKIINATKVHMMLTSQLNKQARGRKSSNEFSYAFSDSISHESDISIRLVQSQQMKDTGQVEIIVGKAREGLTGIGGRFNWNFDTMNFGLIEPIDVGDYDEEGYGG